MPISAKGETHPHSAKPERWSSSQRWPCGHMSTPVPSVVQSSYPIWESICCFILQ